MPATDKIALYDIVELTEPTDGVPAGESGGVVEIFDDRIAMIDLTSLPPNGLETVVVAPLDKLRVVTPARAPVDSV